MNTDNLQEKKRGLIPIFCIGGWEFTLYACTTDAKRYMKRFCDFFGEFITHSTNSCNKTSHLVIASPSVPDKKKSPKWLPKNVHQSWSEFFEAWSFAYKRFCQIRKVIPSSRSRQISSFTFTWGVIDYNNINVFSSISKQNRSIQFFGLVIEKPNKHSHLRLYAYIIFLATRWHIVHNGLLLHSAAIGRGNDGYLFLGGSESGKTSIAKFSASLGYSVLGDDLNFVIHNKENSYILSACPSPSPSPVGYSTARPSLKAVFTLVKDDKEYLKPISSIQTAHTLFHSFMQTPSARRLPPEAVGLAFRVACDIARKVPGYELHFRKSPDFWKIIDKELGR